MIYQDRRQTNLFLLFART